VAATVAVLEALTYQTLFTLGDGVFKRSPFPTTTVRSVVGPVVIPGFMANLLGLIKSGPTGRVM